jgi:hypothetical protein
MASLPLPLIALPLILFPYMIYASVLGCLLCFNTCFEAGERGKYSTATSRCGAANGRGGGGNLYGNTLQMGIIK